MTEQQGRTTTSLSQQVAGSYGGNCALSALYNYKNDPGFSPPFGSFDGLIQGLRGRVDLTLTDGAWTPDGNNWIPRSTPDQRAARAALRGRAFMIFEGELKGVSGEIVQVWPDSAILRVPVRSICACSLNRVCSCSFQREREPVSRGDDEERKVEAIAARRQEVLKSFTQEFDKLSAGTTLTAQECLYKLEEKILQVFRAEGKKGTLRMTSSMLVDALGLDFGCTALMGCAEITASLRKMGCTECQIKPCREKQDLEHLYREYLSSGTANLSTMPCLEAKESLVRCIREVALFVLDQEYMKAPDRQYRRTDTFGRDVFDPSPLPSFYDDKDCGFIRLRDTEFLNVFEVGGMDFSLDSEDYDHEEGFWDYGCRFPRCKGLSEKTIVEAGAPGLNDVEPCGCHWSHFTTRGWMEGTGYGERGYRNFLDYYVQPAFARGTLILLQSSC